MRGRIRIAAVGLVAMTVVGALSSTAGATVTKWNVQGNGGFVSLDLLNTLQLSGGGSEADAGSTPLAEASGTGACLSTAASSNPCPTSATSSLSGFALDSTQDAVANGAGKTGTPSTPQNCTLPINTGLHQRRRLLRLRLGLRGRQRQPDGFGHREPGQRVHQPEPDERAAAAARRLAAGGIVDLRRRAGRHHDGGQQHEPALLAGAGPAQHRQRHPAGQPGPQPDQRGRRQ